MDAPQLAWVDSALAASDAPWKIAFFHHPLYSSAGRHGSERDLRALLEPLFVKYGVQVVFSGHDHVYERMQPQQGVTYFVCGSAGQLRRGDLKKGSPLTAVGFDNDQSFLVVTVHGDDLRFEAISRHGLTVDTGDIARVHRP
jgi:3',5'-cyclic AMP phosphodiesterase CpdA